MKQSSEFRKALTGGEGEQPNFEYDGIRTKFICENVFAFYIEKYYNFDAMNPIDQKENNVLEGIKKILNDCRDSCANIVKDTISEMIILNEDTDFDSILFNIGEELFSCKSWHSIIAFFIFVGELAIMGISQKLLPSKIETLNWYFYAFVKDKLESWIKANGDWEGILN